MMPRPWFSTHLIPRGTHAPWPPRCPIGSRFTLQSPKDQRRVRLSGRKPSSALPHPWWAPAPNLGADPLPGC